MRKGCFYIIVIVLLLFISSFIIKSDKSFFKIDGIKYAVSVDNVSVNEFPEKAPYDVDIECQNADSSWNYEDWYAEIYNITDNVSCNINFTSRARVNINEHIVSLTGSAAGSGRVVEEIMTFRDLNNKHVLLEEEYGKVDVFSNSSFSSSTGTEVTNAFTFNDGVWSTIPANLNSGSYYHFKFNIPSDGFYQFCYTLSVGNTLNALNVYKNNSSRIYINGSAYLSASTTEDKVGCIDIGDLTTDDFFKITQRAFTSISTLSFSFQKIPISTQNAGIRYEGKNPNNYIKFNNETWRIIGIMDTEIMDNSGNVTGVKKLTKLIRNEPIGSYAFKNVSTYIWQNTNVYNLLNTYYYNSSNGQNSGDCYSYINTITGHCDYTNTGIKTYYRNMVPNVKWYLGGLDDNYAISGSIFGIERSTNDENYHANHVNNKTANGYIGLMYVSDYVYSILASDCSRDTDISEFQNSSCAGSSWLKLAPREWTIMPRASNESAAYIQGFYVSYGGMIEFNNVRTATSLVRPVLYLDPSVYIISGNGSEANPYYIAMD